MATQQFRPTLYHYIRRGWYTQQINFCNDVISKKGRDPAVLFWRAFALGMTNKIDQFEKIMETFSSRKDMNYPVTLALLYFCQRKPVVDSYFVDKYNAELSVAEDITKEAGIIIAARFFLFTGDLANASRLVDKVLRGSAPSTAADMEAKAIEFWINVLTVQYGNYLDVSSFKKMENFISSQNSEQLDLDLLMAWCRVLQIGKKKSEALNVLNQIIAMYPWFLPGLTEKAALLASLSEWDQALDTAQRALDIDPEDLEALKIVAVHGFTQQCQPQESLQKLEDLERTILSRESTSSALAAEISTLFSRICSRHPRALQICANLLDHASDNGASGDAALVKERAYISMLQGQFAEATRLFRIASKNVTQSVASLEGMILCQLYEGQIEDAEAQIELLLAMHSENELSPQFKHIQALLAYRVGRNLKSHEAYLDQSRELFFEKYKESLNGWVEPLSDLVQFNPDFALQLAVGYLLHLESPVNLSLSGSASSAIHVEERQSDDMPAAVRNAMSLFSIIQKRCPGMPVTYIELSRCHLSLGRYDEALKTLRQLLQLQPGCTPALIMSAKIEVARCNTTNADRILEQAFSLDFAIRSVPLFRLVRVSVQAQQGRIDEALTEAIALKELPDIKSPGGEEGPGRMHTDSLRMTDDDRVMVYIIVANLLSKSRRQKEANKIISEAKLAFAGSAQEVQVLVASSQLAVERNDFDTAIRMLDKIKADSPTFNKAQMIKADILLTHTRDKEAFTNCYQKIVEVDPSAKSYSLLGEAYIRILNPEAAVEAFEKAYSQDPANSKLRSRIGKALIATHEYNKATNFYEGALRDTLDKVGKRNSTSSTNSDFVSLSHDLAQLYMKLGRVESCRRVLDRVLERPGRQAQQRDISDVQDDVQTLMMLYKLQLSHAPAEVIETLNKAKELQQDVLSQIRTSLAQGSEAVEAEKFLLSDIYEAIGTFLTEKKEDKKDTSVMTEGIAALNEALQHNPQNVHAMLSLARLHLRRSELEPCQTQCRKIIAADPKNSSAAIMLSDVLFREGDADSAVAPLQELVNAQPNDYVALEKMIVLLRRSGKLSEVPKYFEAAEANDRRSKTHAGLRYCRGLYSRYTNDIAAAIKEFNLARTDETWGADALSHMVELYLNPDQEGAWEEREGGGETQLSDETSGHITIAEALLKELRPKAKDQKRFKILENYHMLATRNKTYSDKAMQSFIEILEAEPDNLPAVLGMATGFMMERNQHKARNLLKRVGGMELSKADGEDFEKANLLLAKFYVDKTKNDLAQDLCKRCLAQNKSCSQAWEILGLAMERDMDYEHASECYEKAWQLEFEASAAVGFKLAFSLLKCRKFIEAIDVCEQVLALYPDYPRMREEILRKAQNSLRP